MPDRIRANCFNIVNFNGKPVLFRTDDVLVNKFDFTIINLTGAPLALKGGIPDLNVRANLPAASDASTFSIDFESMLSDEVVAGLNLTLPGNWTSAYIPGNVSTPPSWALSPMQDITIGINETIEFKIENIKCSATRPGNFEIMYRNIAGYDDLVIPIGKHLDVLTPPDPKKKTLPLKDGYINPVHPITGQKFLTASEENEDNEEVEKAEEAVPVYITYDAGAVIENGFTFILTNTSKEPLVNPANDPSGNDNPPVLYISFVFGNEDYAITTQALGDNNIRIDLNTKLPWQLSAHTGGTSYWQFAPQSPKIMEGLETIYFPIHKIITPLNIPAEAISIMYIQLNNVPGYNDAVYTLQMHKITAVADMVSLEANKYTIDYGENIRLSWTSSLAKRVTIEYETRDKEPIILDSAKGEIKLNGTDFLLPVAPSAEYTVIRATAYDNSVKTNSKAITITVNQVQASILSFTTTSKLVPSGAKTDILLQWQTSNARSLILITPEGPKDVTDKTSISLQLSDAFTFTLEAWSYGTQFPAPTRVLQKILGWRAFSPIELALSREIMQKTPAILFNEQSARVYTLNSVNNTIYNINSITGRQEQVLPSISMSLSKDGTRLVSIIPDRGFLAAVTYDMSTGIAVEKFRNALQYEYIHQQQFGTNSKGFYCTVTAEHRGKQWDNYLIEFHSDQLNQTDGYWVGVQINRIKDFPGNFCFSGDQTRVYVVMDQQTLAVVMIAPFTVHSRIKLPALPVAMVSSKLRHKLYIACPATNQLVIVDCLRDTIEKMIEIPNRPSSLILSPDEQFLCIACPGSDNVSIFDTVSGTVVNSLTVGKNPCGLCFSSDGTLLFVTNYCSKTISVVDFANQTVLQPALPTGDSDGNPYAVSAMDNGRGWMVYVTKESWPQRMNCLHPVKDTSDNISVFSILKPANILAE